jgi:AhpD family alkylhydroperoxidase
MTTVLTTDTDSATTATPHDFEGRMTNPAFVLPDGFKGIGHLLAAVAKGGVPETTIELVGLRVSQINGCAACIEGHWAKGKAAGDTDVRLIGVSTWRESPYFDDAERAALALADSLTRIADRSEDPVPDELWDALTTHYDEQQISALLLQIGTLNLFNRINVAVRERADRPSWKQAS